MSDNYVKKEVEPNIIYYVFDNEIGNDEILDFFESIEQDEKVVKFRYNVKTTTDEYETGIYEFSNAQEIDRNLLNNPNTIGITMSVFVEERKLNTISHNINSNAVSLNCKESPEVSNIVESHITRQLSR